MCFRSIGTTKARIAKTDIECWKILWSDYSNLYKYALGKTVYYKKNKRMPKVKIQLDDEINEGYHSFITKAGLLKDRIRYGELSLTDAINVRCIIPKGTRYYKNRTQYVSETIMLVE